MKKWFCLVSLLVCLVCSGISFAGKTFTGDVLSFDKAKATIIKAKSGLKKAYGAETIDEHTIFVEAVFQKGNEAKVYYIDPTARQGEGKTMTAVFQRSNDGGWFLLEIAVPLAGVYNLFIPVE